jgi:phosphatidylserine decarboxylase
MVAATNVGAITCTFEPRINSTIRNTGRKLTHIHYGGDGMRSSVERQDKSILEGQAIHLKKGDEAGIFSMGSSVVMLIDQALSLRLGLSEERLASLRGQAVKLGQSL